MAVNLHHPASFRDPSGFIIQANGKFYRQVNKSYADNYELLMQSGLFAQLTAKKLLIPHTEVNENITGEPDQYKTLLPLQLRFISYAYEWCFDQLKDAALLTLQIVKASISHGMILKDATPFNIQFYEGEPVFIDTLSFEKYDETRPWIAYRQFCECFLFPLYLSYYLNIDAQKFLITYPEGIPVEVAAKLLPGKSKLNAGVWLHVYLQNSVKQGKSTENKSVSFSKQKMIHLIENLESIVKRLKLKATVRSAWDNYYDETILSRQYLEEKKNIFTDLLKETDYKTALDAGANNGFFSMMLAKENTEVIAIDFDSKCINDLYNATKQKKSSSILPLCVDLTNPSPAIGFQNKERESFSARMHAELVTALALVHHLVLGKNVPLPDVAALMNTVCRKHLIIEFVPLTDEKSLQLIKNKTQHHQYEELFFETCFSSFFSIAKKEKIPSTGRILYLMQKK